MNRCVCTGAVVAFAAAAWLWPGPAWSAAQLAVRDGDKVNIRISTSELMRLAMHEGRIEEYWGDSADLEITTDSSGGVLFLRPTPSGRAKGSVSFFIRDATGRTYNLVAQVEDIESDSIILRASGPQPRPANVAARRHRAEPYVASIKRLLKAMARGAPLSGYTIARDTEERALWEEASLVRVAGYQGDALLGETFSLTNISEEGMRLSEGEFVALGDDVQAVAVEKQELEPGETTRVYVIRGRAR